MSDDVVRLSMIGQIVRKRWRLLLVLALVGAVVGAAASLLVWPSSYQSESQVLLPGKLEDTQMRTETQIAMSLVVRDRTAAKLNWGIDGAGLEKSVEAGVVNGNVIDIQGSADSPERAQQLTSQLTEEYITFATEIATKTSSAASASSAAQKQAAQGKIDQIQQQVDAVNLRISQTAPNAPDGVAARAELQRLANARTAAIKELSDLDTQASKTDSEFSTSRDAISIIEPAAAPSAASFPTRLQLILGGAVLGALLGAFTLLAIRHADRRLRRSSDIAAAIGAPVVGIVQVPPEPIANDASDQPDGDEAATPLRRRRGRSNAAARPSTAGSLEYLRYQRAMARLRREPNEAQRLLVLFVDDDALASRAVAQLAIVTSTAGRPVSLVTDRPELVSAVEALCIGDREGSARLTVVSRTNGSQPPVAMNNNVLSVVAVAADRPTVPTYPGIQNVLVVVTSGTRTPWELVAVAGACQDAGHRVAGVLVVIPSDEVNDDLVAEPVRLAVAPAPRAPTAALASVPREQGGRYRG